ncbi:RNA-directed DNA polymerase from mobile element jockey-like, partial [Brachionus plicatilis]
MLTTQIQNIITELDVDFISLNETYLKKSNKFNLNNYMIIRADRVLDKKQKGGGAALGIRKNFKGKSILFPEFEEIAGFEIELSKQDVLSVFSYYSSPDSKLNKKFFDFIVEKYKNFIILGDLNAKILDNEISDHQPTLTTFNNIVTVKKVDYATKINWSKFHQSLSLLKPIRNQIITESDFNEQADKIISDIQNAINTATIKFRVSNNNNPIISVPENILNLIKEKRKIRRIFQKSQLSDHKKVLNAINNRLKKALKIFKNIKTKTEFKELSSFNQSSSKHWALVRRLENAQEKDSKKLVLNYNNQTLQEDQDIAEAFSEGLAETFSQTNNNNLDTTHQPETEIFGNFEYISTTDLFCKTWGFYINTSKTCYTTFTTAGERKNYTTKYKLNLKIVNNAIPMEPNPTFLGI